MKKLAESRMRASHDSQRRRTAAKLSANLISVYQEYRDTTSARITRFSPELYLSHTHILKSYHVPNCSTLFNNLIQPMVLINFSRINSMASYSQIEPVWLRNVRINRHEAILRRSGSVTSRREKRKKEICITRRTDFY